MTAPIPSLNSSLDLGLNSAPKVEDPILYEALSDIHNAIEKLVRQYDITDEDIIAFIVQYRAIKLVGANYSMLQTDGTVLVSALSAAVTVTLPTAVGVAGTIYTVKCINNTYDVVVVGSGGQTIDAISGGIEINLRDSITVKSDGTNWWIV